MRKWSRIAVVCGSGFAVVFCGAGLIINSGPEDASNQTNNENSLPRITFDYSMSEADPSEEEKRAVFVAKKHLERNLPASIDAFFLVTTEPSHYFVTIHYIVVDDQGDRFSVGDTGVYVSREFVVTEVLPGLL